MNEWQLLTKPYNLNIEVKETGESQLLEMLPTLKESNGYNWKNKKMNSQQYSEKKNNNSK